MVVLEQNTIHTMLILIGVSLVILLYPFWARSGPLQPVRRRNAGGR